ncbi:MAG: XRE family transcriptional regulator [Mycobacterium sp.]|nr:MAG: XRE family transcriptional regulator [Mycobacterium sp.]
MSIWWEYVVRIAKTEVQKKMAADTGISETAFSRWKNGTNKPEAPHVITFARAYGRPAVEALVAAGILSADDAGQAIEIHRGVDDFTDSELLEAIGLRMKGLRNALEIAKEQAASSEAPPHEKNPDEQLANDGEPDPLTGLDRWRGNAGEASQTSTPRHPAAATSSHRCSSAT